MGNENIAKSSQEQAVAAWIDYCNHLRFLDLAERLAKQNINFDKAVAELQKLKEFVSQPEHILGSMFTKHGEVAEHVQVRFANAEQLIHGGKTTHSFEGVARTAPEDYLRNGKMVQSKFYYGPAGTLLAVDTHLNTYPWFIENGGTYDIPNSQWQELMRVYHGGESGVALAKEDVKLYEVIKDWESVHNVKFDEVIHPSLVDYDEVQLDTVQNTIQNEEIKLEKTDQELRDQAYEATKPTLQEGVQVTLISAGIEGGLTFVLGVYKKRKEGKHLSGYTTDDWKELGIDTGKGTIKGAIRGSGIYLLTNFAATPAPVASAMITATLGMVAEAYKLQKGEIDSDEFIDVSEALCLDVTVSALSSVLGTILIPIPILGTVIGNAAGMFMKNIASAYLSEKEQRLIESYQQELATYALQLEDEYQAVLEKIKAELNKYDSLITLAFSEDVNVRLETSISVAHIAGVSEDRILDAERGDAFFLVQQEL